MTEKKKAPAKKARPTKAGPEEVMLRMRVPGHQNGVCAVEAIAEALQIDHDWLHEALIDGSTAAAKLNDIAASSSAHPIYHMIILRLAWRMAIWSAPSRELGLKTADAIETLIDALEMTAIEGS